MKAEQSCGTGLSRVGQAPVAVVVCSSAARGAAVPENAVPREEERIVLILDIVDSTGVAERLGNVRFHSLLSDVFVRLSGMVEAHGGEVQRLVGDQIIATWPLCSEQENARAVQCVFACREALDAVRCTLVRRYGEALTFRAALHFGPLAAGEIGGAGPEVVLLGDAMNTAARIEQACRTTGQDTLLSLPLLRRIAMPADLMATSTGSHLLRGKSRRLELFALTRCSAVMRPACFVLKACA